MDIKEMVLKAVKSHPSPKMVLVSTFAEWSIITDEIGLLDGGLPVYIYPPIGAGKFYIQ